jgi:hypothetical protein
MSNRFRPEGNGPLVASLRLKKDKSAGRERAEIRVDSLVDIVSSFSVALRMIDNGRCLLSVHKAGRLRVRQVNQVGIKKLLPHCSISLINGYYLPQ